MKIVLCEMESKKITIFDIARNTTRDTDKNVLNVGREYSMDGFFRLFDTENETNLVKPVFEYDLKSEKITMPDFENNKPTKFNIENKLYKTNSVNYSTSILFLDALFYQTNFLNVYTNNIFVRNYDEGKTLIVGNQVKHIIDYLNYKIPNKLPYVYCNMKTIQYTYNSKIQDIFSNIFEMSKTNNFDYYTTTTNSFTEFETTMKKDFSGNFDCLIVSSNMELKNTIPIQTTDYVVYDEFGISKNVKIQVDSNLEFDRNDSIQENFVMPVISESYFKLLPCLSIGGSCVVISDKADLIYFKEICEDCISKFTSVSIVHPILMSNYIVLVCRNYIETNKNVTGLHKQKFEELLNSILNEFKISTEFDLKDLSLSEIQKLTGCL